MIAATAPPPLARTASDANWAEPAKTTTDITIGATAPISGLATTPNVNARAKPATPNGMPAWKPARIEPR